MKNLFLINPDITFLNFGSFGACSKEVFSIYQQFQLELEQNPIQFITVNGLKYIEKSRQALGNYINCSAEDIVLMQCPTYAVNTIAKSLELKENDEILTTNIEYGACDKTWQFYCDKVGARYIRQKISIPLQTEEQFVEEFFKGVSINTKLIFIGHITSTTALIFPVKKIIEKAKTLNIKTFVDGAHAPGHIPVDIKELDVDYYTAACHKWMMTPKGCSFLYVKKELQSKIDPLVISWGYKALFPSNSVFLDYHQTNGTRDFSAFCTIPAAIAFMQKNNWETVAKQSRSLVYSNAEKFAALLKTTSLAPLKENFIGQMLSLQVNTAEPEKLKQLLFDKYKIEIPVMRQDEKRYLRFSINAFNTQNDLDVLYNALEDIIKTTSFINV